MLHFRDTQLVVSSCFVDLMWFNLRPACRDSRKGSAASQSDNEYFQYSGTGNVFVYNSFVFHHSFPSDYVSCALRDIDRKLCAVDRPKIKHEFHWRVGTSRGRAGSVLVWPGHCARDVNEKRKLANAFEL